MREEKRPVEVALERTREMQLEINEMCQHMITLRERATNISQALTDMPKAKGSTTSKTESSVINILLKGQQLQDKINQFNIYLELIESDIMILIKDRRKQTVLKSRYIYNYSWEKIAQMMKLSVSQVQRHKRIALNVLEKIFENAT